MPIERKYERDIDLLLAEEFAVNPTFAAAFKALTRFSQCSARVADYWVSKSNTLGESDLIIVYEADDGRRFALLIEDKVDAPLQPDQAERYKLRGDRDVAHGLYSEHQVLLCAPRHYLENRTDLDGFKDRIALERIAEIIRSEGGARAEYRSQFLETAGTKRLNTWVREVDVDTNEFWDAAYEMAKRDFPQLEMKPLNVTKGSTWINFRPHDLPTLPNRIYLSFKGNRGFMDLTFTNATAYLFEEHVAHLLDPDMSIHQTGKSAAIRIETPGFLIADGISAALPKVREAFEASVRLISLYRSERAAFDSAAKLACSDSPRNL